MNRSLRYALLSLAAVGGLVLQTEALSAQKALVYCPVGIDVSGCNAVVTALGGSFPDGVQKAYNGSGGTLDLATADLSGYAVMVIPSLSDSPDRKPYAVLRGAPVQAHLNGIFTGRVTVWSGTPDQGAPNRAEKNTLLQNLAAHAAADYASTGVPGLLVLQDQSVDATTRYGWLSGISGRSIGAEARVRAFGRVRALTGVGEQVTRNGNGPLRFSNMATYGLVIGDGWTADVEGDESALAFGVMSRTGTLGASFVGVLKLVRSWIAPMSTMGAFSTIMATSFGSGNGSNSKPGVILSVTPGTNLTVASLPTFRATLTPQDKCNDTALNFVQVTFQISNGSNIVLQRVVSRTLNTNDYNWMLGPDEMSILGGGSFTIKAISGAFTNPPMQCVANATPAAPFTVGKANAEVTLKNLDQTYGAVIPVEATTSASGISSFTITYDGSPTVPVNAGSYTVVATLDNATYEGSATGTLVIRPAEQVIFFTSTAPDGAVYNDLYSVSASGGGSGNPVTFTASGACTMENGKVRMNNVGTCNVTAEQAGNGNYSVASNSQSFSVSKANATVTLGNLDQTYGAVTPVTAATNASGTSSYTITYDGSPTLPTEAGTYSVTATLVNDHYQGNATEALTIKRTTQSITFAELDGKTFGDADFTVSATASSNLAVIFSVSGNCTINNATIHITGAGSCTVTASQGGDANHDAADDVTRSFNIAKATPTITWTTPASITYGTALSDAQLNGSTNGGALSYSPAAGTVLGAGTHTLRVDAAETANYEAASAMVQIEVTKAKAAINVTGVTVTYDGTAHGASGTATGIGDTPLTGLVLGEKFTDAGTHTANWSFTDPAGNYEPASGTADIIIKKAASSVVVSCSEGPFTYTGEAQTPCSVSVTGAGGLNLTPAPVYSDNVNAGKVTASYSFAGDNNHEPSANSTTFEIGKADATLSVTGKSVTYDGTAHGASGTATGVKDEDLMSLLALGESFTNAPGGTAAWSFAGNGNYNAKNGSVAIEIGKADAEISVTDPKVTYDGNAHGANGKATGADGTGLGHLLKLGEKFTNAGTYLADWSFPGDANHKEAKGPVTITIEKAPTNVAVECPLSAGTYNGTAYTPCSATATGAGGLSEPLPVIYENNTNAGLATASANYAESQNHLGNSDKGGFTIDKAKSTVVVSCNPGPFIYTGKAHTPCTAEVTGVGDLKQPLTVTYKDNVNVGTATATASYAESTNHLASNGKQTFGIGAWTAQGFHNPVGINNSRFIPASSTEPVPTVDKTTIWNTAKGGSTIPLKFTVFAGASEVTSTNGIVITKTKLKACELGAGEDEVQADPKLDNAGATDLRYTGGQFIQNWKTPTEKDVCYRVAATLPDKSVIYTFVWLKK